jgi:hypothetical protein
MASTYAPSLINGLILLAPVVGLDTNLNIF